MHSHTQTHVDPSSCSIRILPHHQDTGGFFVAVLEKHRILPWQKKPTSLSTPSASISDSTSQEVQEELTKIPSDQSPLTAKEEETQAELLETPNLTTTQSDSPPPATESKAGMAETAEEQSPQDDKVVIIKPPTAATYKMLVILIHHLL